MQRCRLPFSWRGLSKSLPTATRSQTRLRLPSRQPDVLRCHSAPISAYQISPKPIRCVWLQDSRPLAPALAALCRVAKEANACPRGIHSSLDLPDPWQRGDDPCETEDWLRNLGASRYRRRAQGLGVARVRPAEALPATNGSWSARSGGFLRSIARSMIRVSLRHGPDYPHGL